MLHNVLTQMRAKNLGAGKYADGQGLWLVKRNPQAGNWILRMVVSAKRREMGLGRWPDVSIAEARERAAAARLQLRDGVDPIVARTAKRRVVKRLTVAEAIGGCFESKRAELKRDGAAGRWLSPLSTHVIPKLGDLPIEDLNQHVIVETLGPIWHDRADSARKAMNRINLTLKHAAALGLDVDLQATMKARALLGKQRHVEEHIPSLPYQDAPAFYQWLKTLPGVTPLALRFLMLTLCRVSEVRLATFGEIEGSVWTIPPERTKTGRQHRVPLTDEALAIIETARAWSPNDHLFASAKGKPLSDMAMSAFMKREGYDARPHGFRATFRTWAEEQTDAPFEVKEAILGHHVDAGVVGAYQRSDRMERRAVLLLNWLEYMLAKSTSVGNYILDVERQLA